MLSKYKLEQRAAILAIGGAASTTLWGWVFEEYGGIPWWTYFCVTGLSIFVLSYGFMSEWGLGILSKQQVEEAEVYRREFLANISHELRTSVFVVQGLLDTLKDESEGFSEQQQRLLERASRNLAQLTQLVEDIRSTSLFESGEIRMHPTVFDIQTLCAEVLEELEASARKAKINLSLRAKESTSVCADRKYIGQVIRNLVQNGYPL